MIGLPNCKQREQSLQRHEHQARPRAVAALRGCLHSIGLSHLQRPLANKHPNATAGQFLSKRLFCSHFSNPDYIPTYFLDKNQTLKPLIFSLEGTETCKNNKNRKLTNIFNDGIKTLINLRTDVKFNSQQRPKRDAKVYRGRDQFEPPPVTLMKSKCK